VGVEIGNVAKDEGAREEILSCSISVSFIGLALRTVPVYVLPERKKSIKAGLNSTFRGLEQCQAYWYMDWRSIINFEILLLHLDLKDHIISVAVIEQHLSLRITAWCSRSQFRKP
jgi:hypothetical protein